MTRHWIDQLRHSLRSGPCVVVTITGVRGSAPRETGSHMLITDGRQWGSIGGGNLEHQSTAQARDLLASRQEDHACEHKFGLGPALNQCCGGSVTVLFELFCEPRYEWLERCSEHAPGEVLLTTFHGGKADKWCQDAAAAWPQAVPGPVQKYFRQQLNEQSFAVFSSDGQTYFAEDLRPRKVPLALFGAGHVAQALVPLLDQQPFELHWTDSRSDLFPPGVKDFAQVHQVADPVGVVRIMPPGTAYLVMTHSHELDEDICDAILQREDIAWLGLIGSETKRRRFEHRLAAKGHTSKSLERLVSPVGLAGIRGKRPATIAVTILAQLLRDCVPEQWR
ncbi:MAG: xanthine dehydrogenase accessory protein XdhC [Xanthomonadales bacterium]|nr:xanthine dehydrogenase accessory protein XdhC [Xanthomonadales bacterium]